MKFLRWSIPAAALFFLSGCFQVSEVMHLNPDGSGTVEETVLLSKKFFAGMNDMIGGLTGEGSAKPEPLDLFDPAKLKEQAGAMGEGVTYQSGKKLETADFTGYTAVYAFKDINTLILSQQGPALGTPTGEGQQARMVSFHFTKSCQNSPATLTIEQPAGEKPLAESPAKEAPPAATSASTGTAADEEAAKLVKLFMGMKFVLAIDINGDIVSTNATYRDGNRLTLVEFDMEKLGGSAADMEKLSRIKPGGSLDDVKEALKDIPGMKVDMNEKLNVVFDN